MTGDVVSAIILRVQEQLTSGLITRWELFRDILRGTGVGRCDDQMHITMHSENPVQLCGVIFFGVF